MTAEDGGTRPESIAASALRVYAYAIGLLLIVLSAAREPSIAKVFPTGVIVGGLLISAAAMRANDASGPRAIRVLTAVRHVLALGWVAMVALPPSVIQRPFLERLRELPDPETSATIYATVYGLGAALWLIGMLAGLLVPLEAAASMAFVPERRLRPRAELLIPLVTSVGVAVALVDDDPMRWLRPPVSLGTAAILAFAAGGALTYIATAQGWSGGRDVALVALGGLGLGMLALARPIDLLSANVEVIAPRAELDAETRGYVDRAMRRTGFDAHGERIQIRWSASPPGPLVNSTREFEGGVMRITITADLPAERRSNFAMYQIASALVDLRGGADPMIRNGYAYWSAQNPFNPFVTGPASGFSVREQCGRTGREPTYDTDAIALYSLPFVLAERQDGMPAARRAFDQGRRSTPAAWYRRLRGDCATFLSRYAGPEPPGISVDPTAQGQVQDEVVQRTFAVARERSGLDAKGRPIVVRIGTLPAGTSAHSDFTRERNVITLSPQISNVQIEESLVFQITGIFLTAHYAPEGNDIEPVRSGFAAWASRQRADPFSSTSSEATARQLCAEQFWLTRPGTNGAVWLSSLPFYLAERSGGATEAQAVLRSALAEGLDAAQWRTIVATACERWRTSAR